MAVSRLQVAGGMWPNCLGAVRKDGIRCLHHLVVGEKHDIVVVAAGAGGVLSTFYVLMKFAPHFVNVFQLWNIPD